MTPDEHVAEGERLLTVAVECRADGRHATASSAAVLGSAHFTAAAALTGIGEIRDLVGDARPGAWPPAEMLMSFLRTVRDETVRTVDGQVILDNGTLQRFTYTSVARAAYTDGLATEHADDAGPVWKLTGRGREAVDRGQV